jgi:cysteine desulfurase
VIDAIADVLRSPHNASSIHASGRAAKSLLEQSRRTIAAHLGCFPAELIFTSCGTEANNMALKGVAAGSIAVTATEHSSVLQCVPAAYKIPVDANGVLKMDALEQWLQHTTAPALVSVMLANNETGVIQPIAEIATLVHRYGGWLHCDAVQAYGKIPVDIGLLRADMISISAHKIGGGQGAGALFIANHLPCAPLLHGGGQEQNRRAGTENLAAIVGFAYATDLTLGMMGQWQANLRRWLNTLEDIACATFPDDNIVFGKDAPRLPNTSLLRIPTLPSETQLIHCDLNHIAASAGSACSSGRITHSHVVEAMLGTGQGGDVLRISGGWHTTQEDIAAVSALWQKLAQKHKHLNQ